MIKIKLQELNLVQESKSLHYYKIKIKKNLKKFKIILLNRYKYSKNRDFLLLIREDHYQLIIVVVNRKLWLATLNIN